ncbi:hypothetical protein CBS101457_002784 [Exobasidium rhododendri]|nr:hypothetical protein CBS101457_002784 [Exobasidium rhododendri]
MIIADQKDNGGGSAIIEAYSIDDPWTSSSSISQQRSAATTSSRPLTWAAGSDRTSSRLQYQASDATEEDTAGARLPDIYEKTWELCRAAEQGNDVDISLGQLGKVVRCAQAIGAADVEQSRQTPSTQVANQILSSGIDIPEPLLDLDKLHASTLKTNTQRHYATVSSPSSTDPWDAPAKDPPYTRPGLPTSTSAFTTSALRGWGNDESEGEIASGTKSPLSAPVYVNPNPTSVHLLPDLGGYLFFRHVLYLVKTPLSSGVKRRYSDFVSLHEYLVTRYPFRLVPPLPPKRLALPHMNRTQAVGSGQQDIFLEQRRLALARYTRNIISHPVLRKDGIIVSFFSTNVSNGSSNSTEENASSWKHPGLSDNIVEEGLDESWKLSEAEQINVPVDMEDKLALTKKMVGVIVDRWNNTVAVFERQVRRMEATSAESTRLSLSLSSLMEVETQTYQASHLSNTFGLATNLLISNSQDYSDLSTARFHTLQNTLDGLKNSRDVWLSLKDLFKRYEKFGSDPIRELLNRIEINRKKWKSTIEEKKVQWKENCTRLKEEVEYISHRLTFRFDWRAPRSWPWI